MSPTIDALLADVGYHASAAPGRRRCLRVRVGKWLFRLSRLPAWLPKLSAPHGGFARLAAVSRSLHLETVTLWRETGALPWDLAILRDKERPKISFFDIGNRRKTVVWSLAEDCLHEVSAAEMMEAHGVSIFPMGAGPVGNRSIVQVIVRQSFLVPARATDPIVEQLVNCVAETASPENAEAYLTAAEAASAAISAELGFDPWSFAAGQLDRRYSVWRDSLRFALAHGDISSGNIITAPGGQPALIDFDRAFRASIYYDVMFAFVGSRLCDADRAANFVDTLTRRVNGLASAQAIDLRTALLLFIIDNLFYIHMLAGERDGWDGPRQHTFTKGLILDAKHYLERSGA